jgi:hypothetical protein
MSDAPIETLNALLARVNAITKQLNEHVKKLSLAEMTGATNNQRNTTR